MTQSAAEKKWRQKYASKRSSTKGRVDKAGKPIEFRLSFEDYVGLYQAAGKTPGASWVLSRKDDLGHYELGNCEVIHHLKNLMIAHGMDSEENDQINLYATSTGYKRTQVTRYLKSGTLNMTDIQAHLDTLGKGTLKEGPELGM